jgi:hypothetical protein
MRSSTTKHAGHKAHQTVTEDFIELSTGSESIRIGFTEQKISGRAGISTFCGFLGWHRFGELLAKLLPQREAKAAAGRGGRPAQPASEIALGFLAGILSGAQRLTHIGWLRADPMLRQLLGVEWASGKLHACDALRIFLAQWARLLSWQEVASRFQVQ